MNIQNEGAVSSTKWTLLSSVINAIITLVIGAILARLLNPAIFGLIAIAFLVVALASFLTRLGVGPALIQKENLTPENIGFALTFSIIFSGLVAGVVVLFAPTIALLFKKVEAAPLIAAMGLSLWIASFTATIGGLLRRNMEFRFLSLISVVQTLVTGVLSVIMAIIGFGVWSLVWSLIFGQILGLLIIFNKTIRSTVFKLNLNFSGNKHLLSFGTKYTALGILEYFGSNLDTFFVARLFSPSQVGFYNKAFRLAYLPTENLITSITSVMFPIFSRLQTDLEKFKHEQSRLILFVGLTTISISMAMVPAAKDIIAVLLGNQWLDSILILKIILFAVPFDFMSVSYGLTFDALEKLSQKIVIQSFTLLILIIGFLNFYTYGLPGIAIALVISHVIRYLVYLFLNQKIVYIPWKKIIRTLLMITIAGIIIFSSSYLATFLTDLWGFPSWLALILEIFVCLLVYLLILFINGPFLLDSNSYSQVISKIKGFFQTKGTNTIG